MIEVDLIVKASIGPFIKWDKENQCTNFIIYFQVGTEINNYFLRMINASVEKRIFFLIEKILKNQNEALLNLQHEHKTIKEVSNLKIKNLKKSEPKYHESFFKVKEWINNTEKIDELRKKNWELFGKMKDIRR